MEQTNAVMIAITKSAEAVRTGERTKVKAIDLAFEAGIRAADLLKSGEAFRAEVFKEVEAAVIAGLFTKAEAQLLAMTADQAKSANRGTERTALTRILSKYIGNFRSALERRDPDYKPKEKATDAEKAGAPSESESDSVPESMGNGKTGGVNPSESLETFIAGLNIMIVATRQNDAPSIHKNRDNIAAVLAGLIREIQG